MTGVEPWTTDADVAAAEHYAAGCRDFRATVEMINEGIEHAKANAEYAERATSGTPPNLDADIHNEHRLHISGYGEHALCGATSTHGDRCGLPAGHDDHHAALNTAGDPCLLFETARCQAARDGHVCTRAAGHNGLHGAPDGDGGTRVWLGSLADITAQETDQ